MPEWLRSSWTSGVDTPVLFLAWRIGIALALGAGVAGLYRWARRGASVAPTFLATLILLAALIAMVTQIIGDNVARAFSLVGALSVVRFRTVVKDTQDTAFVIFAVAVGMAAGAGHLAVGVVGLVLVGLASPALWPRRRDAWQEADSLLTLRVGPAGDTRAAAEAVLATAAERYELVAVGTARKGASLDLSYRITLRPGSSPADLVAQLNGLSGMEGVELRRED